MQRVATRVLAYDNLILARSAYGCSGVGTVRNDRVQASVFRGTMLRRVVQRDHALITITSNDLSITRITQCA